MDWLESILLDRQSAALVVNLVLQSLLLPGIAWCGFKMCKPKSTPLGRGILVAVLISATLVPPLSLILHSAGVSWEMPAFVLGDNVSGPGSHEKGIRFEEPPRREPLLAEGEESISTTNETVPSLQKGEGKDSETVAAPPPPLEKKANDARTGFVLPEDQGWLLVASINLFKILWPVVALAFLMRIVFGWRHLVRFKKNLKSVQDPRMKSLSDSARAVFGFRSVPLVCTTGVKGSPFSTGLVDPRVVLPRNLFHSLNDDELRAVIFHEFAHVAHGDLAVGLLQRLAAALFWWNPFVHGINAELAEVMEALCDNHAVAETKDSRLYAQCLVNVAEKTSRIQSLPGAVGLRHPRWSMERRVMALLSKERDMNTRLNRKVLAALIGLFLLGSGVLAGTRVAVAPQEEIQEKGEEKGIVEVLGDPSRPRATQRAVEWGLQWLKRHQHPDGFWDCDGFTQECIGRDDHCTGVGNPLNDVGATGLALLAFLGSGSTPTQGPYKGVVKKAVTYLHSIQGSDGCIPPKEGTHFMYNHGVASLALIEAYGLSGWLPLKRPATRAVEFIHKSKNPGRAWRYNLGETDLIEQNDVSVTGWMVMCLVAAKDFNLPVDEADLKDALAYIDTMTDRNTGRTGYKERGSYSSREAGDELIWPFDSGEAMTAVGMLCRIFGGEALGVLDDHRKILLKNAELLMQKLPEWDPQAGSIDYYYWYYGTYAMFQMGGDYWKAWRDHLVAAVVENQRDDGCMKGSWDPQKGPWGDTGGRVYSTALCTLCLETFYRYEILLGGTRRFEEIVKVEQTDPGDLIEKINDEEVVRKYSTPLAVDRGLKWLARHQDAEGFWDCDHFQAQCDKGSKACSGKGNPLNDVGATGLALLALLGGGNTPLEGPYKQTVRKGLEFLMSVQDPKDGCLTPKVGDHYMYNHGVSSLALLENYGISRWEPLKGPAEKTLEFIHESKNPGKAWRYNIGEVDPVEQNDVSVTGWMVMCLVSAHDFGLPMDRQDLADALMYIDDKTDHATGRTGYKERGSYSSREAGDELIWPFDTVEAMTAVGMLCRIYAGEVLGNFEEHKAMVMKGAKLLRDRLPKWDMQAGTIDYYYFYFGTCAMAHVGGDYWKEWKDNLLPALMNHQVFEGCELGSWPPEYGPWGDAGGRVYSTALSTLALAAMGP